MGNRGCTQVSVLLTSGGRMADVAGLTHDDLDPEVIAHALANLCRFTGHCRTFYSVAQHSVLVASLLPRELKFAGLMHDATEAFVGDLATPIKVLLPFYIALEKVVWCAIAKRYHLPMALPPAVKRADLIALATEKRDLMPAHSERWLVLDGIEPDRQPVCPVDPELAKFLWLDLFDKLGGNKR
jgi:hypothetical protein